MFDTFLWDLLKTTIFRDTALFIFSSFLSRVQILHAVGFERADINFLNTTGRNTRSRLQKRRCTGRTEIEPLYYNEIVDVNSGGSLSAKVGVSVVTLSWS